MVPPLLWSPAGPYLLALGVCNPRTSSWTSLAQKLAGGFLPGGARGHGAGREPPFARPGMRAALLCGARSEAAARLRTRGWCCSLHARLRATHTSVICWRSLSRALRGGLGFASTHWCDAGGRHGCRCAGPPGGVASRWALAAGPALQSPAGRAVLHRAAGAGDSQQRPARSPALVQRVRWSRQPCFGTHTTCGVFARAVGEGCDGPARGARRSTRMCAFVRCAVAPAHVLRAALCACPGAATVVAERDRLAAVARLQAAAHVLASRGGARGD